jgi:hypothetical protein
MKKYSKPAIRMRQMVETESTLAGSFTQDTKNAEEVDDGTSLNAKGWTSASDGASSGSSISWDD